MLHGARMTRCCRGDDEGMLVSAPHVEHLGSSIWHGEVNFDDLVHGIGLHGYVRLHNYTAYMYVLSTTGKTTNIEQKYYRFTEPLSLQRGRM